MLKGNNHQFSVPVIHLLYFCLSTDRWYRIQGIKSIVLIKLNTLVNALLKPSETYWTTEKEKGRETRMS